jgi:hypothetical protein
LRYVDEIVNSASGERPVHASRGARHQRLGCRLRSGHFEGVPSHDPWRRAVARRSRSPRPLQTATRALSLGSRSSPGEPGSCRSGRPPRISAIETNEARVRRTGRRAMPPNRSDCGCWSNPRTSRGSRSDSKEAVDGTLEDHLHSVVVLERRDDLSVWNEFGPMRLSGGLSSTTRRRKCNLEPDLRSLRC